MCKPFAFILLILFADIGAVVAQNMSLVFDGKDDFITYKPFSKSFSEDSKFTLSFWIKTHAAFNSNDTLRNSNSTIFEEIAKESGQVRFALQYINGTGDLNENKLMVYKADGQNKPSLYSSRKLNDKNWHHVAVVNNQKMMSLYIDGTIDGFVTDNTNGPKGETPEVYIGTNRKQQVFFTGAIDELRVRDKALDAAEVRSDMISVMGNSDDLVLGLNFNQSPFAETGQDCQFMNFENNEPELLLIAGPDLLQRKAGFGWWAELMQARKNYENGEAVNLSARFMWQTFALLSSLALISYLVYRWILKRNQILAERREAVIQEDLNLKNKQLVSQTLHLVNKNAVLQDLKEDLNDYQKSSERSIKEISKIIRTLQRENASEAGWEVFKAQFNEIHNDFDLKIRSINESVTDQEIRLAALIKMKLTTKEIAEILNVQAESVRKSKFRLKKKLALGKEVDFDRFLWDI
ncbi:MAG: LamG domain-containing protein [Cytophagales bacterium]|nr:LamG domain-containing protein [Cytophagales bacterium]